MDATDWRAFVMREHAQTPLACRGARMTPLGMRLAVFLRRLWPFVPASRLLAARAEYLALRDECLRTACSAGRAHAHNYQFTKTQENTMQIEAGKYYRTRDGRKVGPVRRDGGTRWGADWWDFAALDNGMLYAGGGATLNHTDDLVAEWVDAQQQDTPAKVDTSTLRDGDIVHVRGVMDGCGVRISGTWCPPRSSCDIVHVEPRPIAVGDKTQYGEVLALAKGQAWFGGASFCSTSELRRV